MSDFYEEYKFDDAEAFLDALTPWTRKASLDGYIFRGHSNDSYELLPSALRLATNEVLYRLAGATVHHEWVDDESILSQAEFRTIRDFYRLADAHGLEVPTSPSIRKRLASSMDHSMATYTGPWINEELLDIAALAQHYGLPTRLLDWTHNPYVAAFFAASGCTAHGDDLSIWCLNKDHITLYDYTRPSKLKFIQPHYSGNPNLAAQSGVFTHWEREIKNMLTYSSPSAGTVVDRTPLDELVTAHYQALSGNTNVLKKFKLRASEASKIRRYIAKIGYTSAKIFPGYGGVAEALKDRQHHAS